ncbi:hypothetical protein LNKW23_30770 [Paralimibaculum aggregatum]|uniref:Uncharacterized protein n=1 Tax=Paralimibaculum aggregatum TaxID=3036245 RepID=A0ABQ6LQL3_9RHOB|nr:hypothetical protein [Limibaculum sp. NKW23]GMG83863.1 hypothetical protein LNKW23_30770 [Limibaculum sp. NKW23]
MARKDGARPAAEAGFGQVFLLMVEVGRAPEDGLPPDCDGAALLCFATGTTEQEAVNETVAVLRQAEMAPLSVESHGNLAERLSAGHPLSDEDRALARRALAENAVIVAQIVPFEGDEDDDEDTEDDEDAR